MTDKRYKLENLQPFCEDMVANCHTAAKFDFVFTEVVFSCLVGIDAEAGEKEIIIGGKAINFFCVLPVDENYTVPSLSDDDFFDLKRKLGLNYNGGKGFNSFAFLRVLDQHIPEHYAYTHIDPKDYGNNKNHVKSLVDEDSKIYFCCWIEHGNSGKQARNIEKTRIMTGSDEIAEFCKRYNISSCWTSDPAKAKDFELPPHYKKNM